MDAAVAVDLRWAEKYIGIPFVDGGRGWAGCDCWGLNRLIFKVEKGIELPSYGEISARDLAAVARAVAGNSAIEPWIPVEGPPRKFDVAVMFRRAAPVHIGTMLAPALVLHTELATSSVAVSLTHPSVAQRHISIFRHKDLADVKN